MKEFLGFFAILFIVSCLISLFISHIFFWLHLVEEKFAGRDTDFISAIIIGATLFLFPIFGMINIVLIVQELTLDYRIKRHNKKSTKFSNIPTPPLNSLKD